MTALACVLVASALAVPQEGRPPRLGKPTRPSPWETAWRMGGEFRYDTNVWLLDGGEQDRLEDELPGDQVSGRYEDMESVDDLVFNPDVRFEAQGPGLGGRRLEFTLDLEYSAYFENPRRSYLDLDLKLTQGIGRDGRLSLGLGLVPDYFYENYLEDAVDLTGSNSAAERRYEAGVYREWTPELEYRHRILDESARQPFGMDALLAVGWRLREYDSPFSGRNVDAPWFRLRFRFDYGSKWNFSVHYVFEDVRNDTHDEILILDEPDFGLDFNGDGTATDNNARARVDVDRTYHDDEVEFSVSYQMLPQAEVGLSYAHVWRRYESGETFDIYHKDREDARDDFGLFARVRVNGRWSGRLGWDWREKSTDRPANPDAGGETVDYKRHVFSVSLTYAF